LDNLTMWVFEKTTKDDPNGDTHHQGSQGHTLQ